MSLCEVQDRDGLYCESAILYFLTLFFFIRTRNYFRLTMCYNGSVMMTTIYDGSFTDKSSVAGSEEAEPQSPPIKPRETRQKAVQEAPPKKGRRSRRCGQCSGCQVPEDCGVCTNCLDKPKFGGRNIKKQCCK